MASRIYVLIAVCAIGVALWGWHRRRGPRPNRAPTAIRAAVAGWASAVAADKLLASDAIRLIDELPEVTDRDSDAVYHLLHHVAADGDIIERTPHYGAKMRARLQRSAASLRRN